MKVSMALGVLASLALGPVAPNGSSAEEPTIERPFETQAQLNGRLPIDRLVLAKLRELEIEPAHGCSDAVFVRRVFLDVIGTLPTPQEARLFLTDRRPNKRSFLIDRLLERDEFADYWAMKWGDLLRIKAEFPINLWPNAVHAYHRWVRTAIKENMPYDQFVRELLTSSGSNFRVPQVNFYRASQSNEPEIIAKTVALTFMGARTDGWEEDRLASMATFFSRVGFKRTAEWKEEIVFFDAMKNVDAKSTPAVFPDGTPAQWTPKTDPRKTFTNWLTSPENPWFARNIVNRIWFWLLGNGIIHVPDDIRPDNPPINPALLARLETELVQSDYDLQHIFRIILNSKTYQLSSIPRTDHELGARYFAYYPLRRLDAEVLIDALCQITGTTEEYSSPVPEPFTFIPEDQRSIALSDGSITSPFLEMFGRPPRDTGYESERNIRSSAAQRLHLLNSSHIRQKIEQSQRLRWMAQKRELAAAINTLYLTILSRFPTEGELKVVQDYSREESTGSQTKKSSRDVLLDLTWALINSPEFSYRH